MPGLSFYDRQHVQKVLAQQGVINNIFNQFILSVSPYLRKWNDTGNNNVWIRNQVVERAVDRELLNLEAMLKANISAFQVDAWDRSNTKNDDFIRKYIEGMSISAATKEGMFAHNLTALEALQKSVDANGLSLSDRVWDITQQTKTQIEFYLNSGVAVGRNATGISSDVRQILHDPDKRFRRVRNGKGNLVPSRPMKGYHPGQGVYRSAYMNALRTSATTTNIAYRSADYERWSKQDFVLGIEVQRSGNHKGPCKICDAMVGKYPKTFKFTGWHPFCICFATPIVMEPEDLADYLLTDEVPERLVIKEIPGAAQSFVNDNKGSMQSTFWYKDNFSKKGLPKEIIRPDLKSGTTYKMVCSVADTKLNPTVEKDISAVEESLANIVREHPDYFQRGYKGITAVSREYAYMSTDINGSIALNFATDRNGFNAGDSLVSAFDKIKKGIKLTENEEYSIEVLWHEVLHNKSKNIANLPEINSSLGFQRVVAETVNQLVARHSYNSFLKQLGGTAKHKAWVLDNGYGYQEMVANLRSLISKAGINEKTFVREANKILMEDYTDIDMKIENLLKRMYKGDRNIGWVFGMIERKDFIDVLKILD